MEQEIVTLKEKKNKLNHVYREQLKVMEKKFSQRLDNK